MSLDLLQQSIFGIINEKARHIEAQLKADVISYLGGIHPKYSRFFRDFVEEVNSKSGGKHETIAIFLRTAGGSPEMAESMVSVLRKHYQHVYFVVPDFAMSAGTVLCMSADKIFMDYSSSLGPIDPQVPAPDTGEYVPALGYLDKVNELTNKGNLAPADVVLLRGLDLAKLALYEQARDLSIDLLKKWLVKYKFKNWECHRTDETKKGHPVTDSEKEERAEEIAKALGDHKAWRSHGRRLDIEKLKSLRIEIDDYSDDNELQKLIREYNDPLTSYIDRMRISFFLHSHHINP